MPNIHVAVDIGGSSIKITAARLANGSIEALREKTVPNRPLVKDGRQRIDIPALLNTIVSTLREFHAQGLDIQSFGIDTYGNGYGILNATESLMELPVFYKDDWTKGVLQRMAPSLPLRRLYEETGVYPTDIRVLMQLFQAVQNGDATIQNGANLLLFPDILAHYFTGKMESERSMASVASLLDRDGTWCFGVMEKLGIPQHLFAPLINGGDNGAHALTPGAAREIGIPGLQYVDVVSHDTESALLAAPRLDERTIFASLGTSVVFGARTPQPVVSDGAYAGRFKNMRGAFGANSLCRDYNGMWIFEQCMAVWRAESPHVTYRDIDEACAARPGTNNSYFDVNDESIRFFKGDMVQAIQRYCKNTGQRVPTSRREIALCVFESIALEAKWSYEALMEQTGIKPYDAISAVGGGVRNTLFLHMLADALELPLYAGTPYAATTGNILTQLYALGEIQTRQDVYAAARQAAGEAMQPRPAGNKWYEALQRLQQYRNTTTGEEVWTKEST